MAKWSSRLLFCAFMMFFMACQDLDPIYDRLEALETDVKDMKSAVDLLRLAYSDGMVVKSVEPVEEGTGGWLITFSDKTTITIRNGEKGDKGDKGDKGEDGADGRDGIDGKDGVDGIDGEDGEDGEDGIDGKDGENGAIPYMFVDGDGYWCVTYDQKEIVRIMDETGEYVKASGSDGRSLKVVTTSDNYYAFVSSADEVAFDTLKTAWSADPSSLIQSISENMQTHVISIMMGDGHVFEFNKDYAVPASIALLTTRGVELSEGGATSFEFRVNPSDAVFCYDVSSDSCAISLDLVGANKSKKTYVKTPVNYSLTKIEQVYDEQGVLMAGQYRAYLTDNGLSTNYKEMAALVLTVENANGEEVCVSSSAFDVEYCGNMLLSFSFLKARNPCCLLKDVQGNVGFSSVSIVSPFVFSNTSLIADFETNGSKVYVGDKEQFSGISINDFSSPVTYTVVGANGEKANYTVSVGNTGLPLVVIDTEGGAPIDQKEFWMENTGITIYQPDGVVLYQSSADAVRGRGNSTWKLPKKSYALKLSSKSEILGMAKHKRWCLLANNFDRTMMRHDVAFELSRRTGLEWTPSGKYVEVVLNGVHVGNYYLAEQIKVDKNRVNITEMTAADTTASTITGGYLMELDISMDEFNKFRSTIRFLPYMFQSPDEDVLTETQFEWFKRYVLNLETCLYVASDLAAGKYLEYIDMDSFVDFWIVQELTENGEAQHPKSVFFSKDRGGLMKAGPVWDFDFGTYKGSQEFVANKSLYYTRLFRSPLFVARVKERWAALKPGFEEIGYYIDSRAAELKQSDALNIKMWPVQWLYVNEDGTLSFDEAVSRLKTNLLARIVWLDAQIAAM